MTPRTRIIVGAMSVATLLAGATVRAQSDELRAVIPFEFKAGQASLPAGTYTVTRGLGAVGNAVQLRSLRGGAFLLPIPDAKGGGDVAAQLTFHRYGDRYFLHQIRFSRDQEFTLPTTSAEREMVRASTDPGGPSQVVVAIAASR